MHIRTTQGFDTLYENVGRVKELPHVVMHILLEYVYSNLDIREEAVEIQGFRVHPMLFLYPLLQITEYVIWVSVIVVIGDTRSCQGDLNGVLQSLRVKEERPGCKITDLQRRFIEWNYVSLLLVRPSTSTRAEGPR